MMGAGQYNSLVTILKRTETTDSDSGQPVVTFTPYHRKVPALKVDASGGQTLRGDQVNEQIRSVITIPFFDEDVGPEWRVRIVTEKGEPEFEIAAVLTKDDRRREMQLHCADVK